mmetsp:Transcript_84951/g.245632  ORF Transcript_84951/g.245632 Transcript_84951/m.245632 type:complete len:564 (+) Transcript_84951:102-1793(+)
MASGDIEQPRGPQSDEKTPLMRFSDVVVRSTSSGEDNHKGGDDISLLMSPLRWAESLQESYSWKLLTVVVCTKHLLKGFVSGGGDDGLVGKPIEFIFAALHLPASELQMLKAAALSPWALKPVVALLSDALPIFGYRKLPYIAITSMGACVAALSLGLDLTSSVPKIVFCLWLIFLNVSVADLLVEAKQSEEIKQKARIGPQFITFTWIGITIGQIIGVIVLGPLIQYWGPNLPYLVALPFIALVLWPTLANFLGEKPLPVEDRGLNFRMIRLHPVLCIIALVVGAMVSSITVGTFLLPRTQLFAIGIVCASILVCTFFFFIRFEIAGPLVFYFVHGLLSFGFEGAMFYFYTDTPEQFPGGPHFSKWFYTTGIGLSTFTGHLMGFISGEKLFANWNYRSILRLTIPMQAVMQLSYLPLIWRSTGPIPDAVWVVAVAFLDAVCAGWVRLPKQVMVAHMTPHSLEATGVGLSAGSFNLAMILGSYFGSGLLRFFAVEPRGAINETAALAGLWKVVVIAALSQCLMFLLIPVLLPSKSQQDPIISERPDSATHNSPFERYTGIRVH